MEISVLHYSGRLLGRYFSRTGFHQTRGYLLHLCFANHLVGQLLHKLKSPAHLNPLKWAHPSVQLSQVSADSCSPSAFPARHLDLIWLSAQAHLGRYYHHHYLIVALSLPQVVSLLYSIEF